MTTIPNTPKSTVAKQRKGILLAGGSGSRLFPITLGVSKQLVPVYDKPLVYYPLSLLMMAKVRDVLIITTPDDQPQFQRLLGSGSQWGMNFSYAVQPAPNGLAEALIIGEEFLAGAPSCMVLGDNILYGNELATILQRAGSIEKGASIFAYPVSNPEAYGVAELDRAGRVLSIEEKPARPKSHWAIPGIYFYDSKASALAKKVKPSLRGELEITALNQLYLEAGELHGEVLGRGIAWLDAGTHDSLLEASNFISTIQNRQGLLVSCPEEIAWRFGFISREQLIKAAEPFMKSNYGKYLLQMAHSEI